MQLKIPQQEWRFDDFRFVLFSERIQLVIQ